MTRQQMHIDRETQFDLFEGRAESASSGRYAAPSSRQFIAPDPREIFLGMTRLEDHLKQAGLKEPLIVAQLLDQQDWRVFEQRYAVTGRAPYAPRCMMGLILYGVMQGVASLRGLERMARTDLGCMWVSGGICPDHAVIGRFLVLHADSLSLELFEGVTRAVLKATGSENKRLAGDGTVLEAACSHYQLLKAEAAKEHAKAARQEADTHPGDRDRQQAARQAAEVADTLAARQAARRAQGKPTDQLCISATEPEAVVQPLKRNRGKAPAYKPSVLANEDRVVVAQAVHPSSESVVLPALLDQSDSVLGKSPQELLLDAGYFNDAVIEETLARDISLLCPEGRRPGQPRQSSKYFPKSQFQYLADEDAYRCPGEQRLYPTGRYQGNEQAPGYVLYATAACAECPLRSQCTRSKQGRRIKRYRGDEAKDALREVMQHPKAQAVFRQRQSMVEPVFSHLRWVQAFNRFRRRGLQAVKLEFALQILAYNLRRAVVFMAFCLGLWRPLRDDWGLENWREANMAWAAVKDENYKLAG